MSQTHESSSPKARSQGSATKASAPSGSTVVSALLLLAAAGIAAFAATHFRALHTPDPLILGPGVTDVDQLSRYHGSLAGTPGDTEVVYLDSGRPGATMLVLGGVHADEVAGVLAAFLLVEHAVPQAGRLIVIPRANASAATHNAVAEATPRYIHFETPSGERRIRYGARLTNPLHQYPDPEVHVHHGSGTMNSGSSARNLNRNFPGRANGTLTERIAYAITELIREESVGLVLDMHEARPMNPIVNAVVAHDEAQLVSSSALLNLQALEGLEMRLEPSADGFRGVSHRELGEATEALATLSETPQVAMDWLRGATTEALVRSGKDDFMRRAREHGGLVYVDYDHERGLPLEDRVGRHLSLVRALAGSYSDLHADEPITLEGVPSHADVMETTVDALLSYPEAASD